MLPVFRLSTAFLKPIWIYLLGLVAERWEMSTDGLTYTFYLVKNATWHDEKKFTSADVKFTFEQVLLPFHPYGQVYFGVIQSIETPDDYTVRIKLTKPHPPPFCSSLVAPGSHPFCPSTYSRVQTYGKTLPTGNR